MIAVHEIAVWLERSGVTVARGMNRGGTQHVGDIGVSMVAAVHSSSILDGDGTLHPGGEACGFVVTLENGYRVYHAGDTDVFGDMALIGEMFHPDVALLPIGDHYTMGPTGAAMAAKLLGVHRVIPIHWGTFPALVGNPDALRVAGAAQGLVVLSPQPGETLTEGDPVVTWPRQGRRGHVVSLELVPEAIRAGPNGGMFRCVTCSSDR